MRFRGLLVWPAALEVRPTSPFSAQDAVGRTSFDRICARKAAKRSESYSGFSAAFLAPLVLAAAVVVGQLGVRNALLATDFRAYYTAARMLLGGVRAEFYLPSTQFAWQQAWVPELAEPAGLNPFRNPTFVAALFAPLGWLPPEIAFVIWSAVNVALLC